ncbi:MAG: hypothetical protein BWY11_01323 [Firmicutes bacterium ADurb.Bin182]|nr:MAG: hypothetical protein BWY11_01323 [Firmicutes bacterium ADurb.Bin182]
MSTEAFVKDAPSAFYDIIYWNKWPASFDIRFGSGIINRASMLRNLKNRKTFTDKVNRMIESTACFSGHRPEKLPWNNDEEDARCKALKARLFLAIEQAAQQGYTHFITGMAKGIDTYAAEAVLSLKTCFPEITLECAIPFSGQSKGWNSRDKARYEHILHGSDKITILSDKYLPGCMQRRNRYLIKNSSLLIAVTTGAAGGTSQTIKIASERGIRILRLDV